MTGFRLIVIMDQNRGIGAKGSIPWVLSQYIDRVHNAIRGANIILGRNAFMALTTLGIIDMTLPEKIYIVSTQLTGVHIQNSVVVSSFALARQLIEQNSITKYTIVLGGAELYAAAITSPDCEVLQVMEVNTEALKPPIICDAFAPPFPSSFVLDPTALMNGEWNVFKTVSGHFMYRDLFYRRQSP